MRETLASISNLMENLAQEADAKQKRQLRGGVILNSERRAQLKTVANTEKVFRNLMSSLEYQFEELKSMSMPSEKDNGGD